MGAKAKHDIAPLVRGAFHQALQHIERGDDGEEKLTFSQIMAKCIRANPLATLQAVARFAPREQHVSGSIKHQHSIDTPDTIRAVDDFIAGYAAPRAIEGTATPVQDEPVLPDPTHLQ